MVFFPYKDLNVRGGFPHLVVFIILLNIITFLWSLTDFENIIFTYGFIAASASLLTAFTSMFLHGGFDHIFGNMWYLWIFGDNVEDRFGKLKFSILYLSSGLFASFVQYLTNPSSTVPAIGASGAISGILGAYLILFPRVSVRAVGPFYMRVELPAYFLIGVWFALQLFWGTVSLVGDTGSNIAFWAHIGGFIFGVVAGLIYRVFK